MAAWTGLGLHTLKISADSEVNVTGPRSRMELWGLSALDWWVCIQKVCSRANHVLIVRTG